MSRKTKQCIWKQDGYNPNAVMNFQNELDKPSAASSPHLAGLLGDAAVNSHHGGGGLNR
jgi:hypothetical protein